MVTPVHREAMTEFATAADFTDVMADSRRGYLYSRIRNPNSDELAAAVAELEGAEAAHCFASGMAAIVAALDLLAPAGTRVVAPRQLYGQTYALLRRRGDSTFCDITDLDAIARALDGAGLLYVETIANPQIDVADLPALAALAKRAGAAMLVDNTVATPLGCRPLEHGADLVAHSATKYLNGHSDALAGVVAGNTELMAQIATRALDTGATHLARHRLPGAARDAHARPAAGAGLSQRAHDRAHARPPSQRHPGALPGLRHDRAHEVSLRVLNSHGALVAFDVNGGEREADATMDACRLCLRATSLGGVETTISHPASTSHRQLDEAELAAAGLTPGTLRLSVGIEDARRSGGRPGRGAAGVIPAHRSRVSAWWLLGPGLLFGFSFLAAVLTTTTPDKNLVYNLQAIVVTAVVDVVLAAYVVFAVWVSKAPIADTLALRRAPSKDELYEGAQEHYVLLDDLGQCGHARIRTPHYRPDVRFNRAERVVFGRDAGLWSGR